MNTSSRSAAPHVSLAPLVIITLLAFTAVPVELRPSQQISAEPPFDTSFGAYDLVVNVIGYVPLGAVLTASGVWRTLGLAAAVSSLAELTQIVSIGRVPSSIDVATNVLGALLGWSVARRLPILAPRLAITGRRATVALALAGALLLITSRVSPLDVEEAVTAFSKSLTVASLPVSGRGSTSPGRLEVHWSFDRDDGAGQAERQFIEDVSGNGVNGALVHRPRLVAGIAGNALQLNGRNQYAEFGSSTSLRLTGSMTVSALINASSFPASDAVILSNHGGLGYQLDTTADQGARTLAFRITNRWGRLTSRYGRTPIETDTWYHVAGVFDARARALSVYLNGRLDSGCLAGTVTSKQTVSPDSLHVGRPARPDGFEFAGLIDDVRVYSRALSASEVAEMTVAAGLLPAVRSLQRAPGFDDACAPARPPDARTPGLIVGIGLLVAVGCLGLWPTPHYRLPCLTVSAAAGLILAPLVGLHLPGSYAWLSPLLTTVGGLAVVSSIRATLQAGLHETGP